MSNDLERLCDSFRRRLRSLVARAGVCRLVLVALLLLPPLVTLDWWLHLATPWRCLTLAVYLAALAATAWWTLLVPLARRWSNEEVLSYLDGVAPADQGMLLELYELTRAQGIQETESEIGRAMVRQSAEELAPLARQAKTSTAFARRRRGRWLAAAAAAIVLFSAAAVPLAEYLEIGCERLFNPFSTRHWPHETTIVLEEPETGWTVPQLEALPIRATVTGAVPAELVLAYRSQSTGYWIKERIPVRPDGSAAYTFPEVREPFSFYLHGGDFTTDTQRVTIVERPFLRRIVAHYEYPEYAGLPNRDLESGQLFGLEGTKVRLEFESSIPLSKVDLVMDGREEGLPLTTPKTCEKTLVLAADGSYEVRLYDESGFREAKPERYEIRVTPDHPPEVELLSPGQNLVATSRAAIPVAFRASDDFGLKKIEFLVQLGQAAPAPLSDRITGPLAPQGKTHQARFVWNLPKMEGLPDSGVLQYWVRAQDVNPTGRGVTETPKLQIKLVKPSEFHFDCFERAKRLEAEARIAWENQFEAWKLAAEWSGKGSGGENDPLWQELKEKQELAIRAAQAMETCLRELAEQHEQNDMAREFMAGRLGVITELLRRVSEKDHRAIAEALAQARPKTDADAAPERLKGLRTDALARCADNQKLALLCLERLLLRLFDWRDLQTTLIRTTLLHEEQGEVLGLTEQIAPKTLGWEMEDLANDVQDKLLTLGKRQRTLLDVESELEKELEFQMYRAQVQQRRTILLPLAAAYQGLRENRVNDNLKLAAGKIEINQAFQIVKNQKAALHVLNIVKGGLVQAGQKIDPEAEITLAMTPSQVIEVHPKPKPEEPQQPEAAATAETPETTTLSPEDLLANLPLGSDPVTMAVNAAWEAQDMVLARTRYLAGNMGAEEMPRYVQLKQGILLEKQAAALRAVDLAVQQAEKAKAEATGEVLRGVREEFRQSQALIEARQLAAGTQQLQADALESLEDLRRRFIPLQKAVQEAVEENKRHGGADAFNRRYLLRDKDLEQAVSVLDALNCVQILQRDVVRKVGRFVKFPAKDGPLLATEQANRARAAAAERQVVKGLGGLEEKLDAMSSDAANRVRGAGLRPLLALRLGPVADDVASAGKDQALAAPLQQAAEQVAEAVRSLKDLLGEREQPPLTQKGPEEQGPKGITLEEWRRLQSPEALRERLKADTRLPAEVRQIMLRALGREFPAKYRELLGAYYASFVSEEKR
jgi:hypothetical protein